jgi:hypothetical protein
LFCVGLAVNLFRLSFFGFALAVLVVSKASGVVKQSLVPLLVDDDAELVTVNARLSRLGSISGGFGGALAVALLRVAGAPWLLWFAVIFFVAAAAWMSRISPQAIDETSRPDLAFDELRSPTLVVGSIGFMTIRATVGFFVFTLAFTLRRASEPAWVYGVAIAAYGAGAFVGSVVAPLLRRRFRDEQLIAIAIAIPAFPTLVGILGVSRPLLVSIACLIGTSTTLGRHAFDSLLQRSAPAAERGRAAARYESAFQLVWVFGAVIATPTTLPSEAAMAVLAALYLPALAVFVRAARTARRIEHRSTTDPLARARARLTAAVTSCHEGLWRVAIVDAAGAVDLARLVDPMTTSSGHDDAAAERADLEVLRRAALDRAAPITVDDALRALGCADAVLSRGWSTSRR